METTYRLKPGIVWHDGQALTADDFVFAYEVFTNGSSVMSETQTLYTATYVEAMPAATKDVAGLLKAEEAASRADSGVMAFDIVQRIDRPNQFVALAAWASADDLAAHLRLDRVARLGEALRSLLAAPNDRREHFGLSLAGTSAMRTDVLTVVTHVDVVPQFKDDGAEALERLARAGRGHRGNLGFQVWRQTNRSNHFTVVEDWAGRSEFEAHTAAAETREFRTALAEMTGALYDERLYSDLR